MSFFCQVQTAQINVIQPESEDNLGTTTESPGDSTHLELQKLASWLIETFMVYV